MANDPRDYKLEVTGLAQPQPPGPAAGTPKPFLGVKFNCCGTYQRVYQSPDGRFRGRCPRCLRKIEFIVEEGGSDSRFFVVN